MYWLPRVVIVRRRVINGKQYLVIRRRNLSGRCLEPSRHDAGRGSRSFNFENCPGSPIRQAADHCEIRQQVSGKASKLGVRCHKPYSSAAGAVRRNCGRRSRKRASSVSSSAARRACGSRGAFGLPAYWLALTQLAGPTARRSGTAAPGPEMQGRCVLSAARRTHAVPELSPIRLAAQ
jgi:hypothetical protein